jgi:beta-glucosidase
VPVVVVGGDSRSRGWPIGGLYERGLLMGKEFKAKGAHVALSPVAGPLGRSAYSSRN